MRVSNKLVLGIVAGVALVAWLFLADGGRPVQAAAQEGVTIDGAPDRADSGAQVSQGGAAGLDGRIDEGAPTQPPVVDERPALPKGKARLSGRVLDRAGKPVAGARVITSTSESWMAIPLDAEAELLERNHLKVLETSTDAQGAYSFGELDPGKARLVVRASGFAPWYGANEPLDEGRDAKLADIVLEQGVVVRGRVVDGRGQPVPQAAVLVAYDCIRRRSKLSLPGRGAPVATTDKEGEFVVDQLAAGPWHLYVEDGVHLTGEAKGELARAGLEQGGVRIVLDDAWTIAGKVAAKDGVLPPGMRVSARAVEEEQGQQQEEESESLSFSLSLGAEGGMFLANEARRPAQGRVRHGFVAEDGSFVVPALEPNRVYRIALARPRADGEGWRGVATEEIKPAQSGTRNLLIELRPVSALTFKVVDATSGAPLEELLVWGGQGRERSLRTDKGDAQRRFPGGLVEWPELRVNQNGKPFQLRVAATGYLDHEARNISIKTGATTDLGEIRLQPCTVVKATVYREGTREPVPGARVVLADRKEDELKDLSEQDMSADWTWDPKLKFAIADAQGVARLSAPPGKTTSLQASAKGFVPGAVVRQAMPDSGELALELFVRPGGIVEVSVDDGTGVPVVKQDLQHMLPLRPGEDDQSWGPGGRTDEKGVARFEGLAAGVHKFRISPERGNVWTWSRNGVEQPEEPWSEVAVQPGQTATLRLRAKPRGSLSGLVREDGRALEGAGVRLVPYDPNANSGWAGWGGEDDPLLATSDETGRYAFESLPVGTYRLFVTHKNRRHAKEFLVDVNGMGAVFDIDLLVARIEGRVLDEDGQPLVGVEVNLWPQGERIQVEPPYELVYGEDEGGGSDVDWKAPPAATARTDSSGTYVMRGVLTEAPLIVQVQGPWTEERQTEPFTLLDGEVKHGLDFHLRKAGRVDFSLAAALGENEWANIEITRQDGQQQLSRGFGLSRWNTHEQQAGLLPGEWRVKATRFGENGPAGQPRESVVRVEVGRSVACKLELP